MLTAGLEKWNDVWVPGGLQALDGQEAFPRLENVVQVDQKMLCRWFKIGLKSVSKTMQNDDNCDKYGRQA